MYHNPIQWRAKMRLWRPSRGARRLGRRPSASSAQIRNFAHLADPGVRRWRTREEERQLARLESELRGAVAAEIDAGRRYRIIMGQDP